MSTGVDESCQLLVVAIDINPNQLLFARQPGTGSGLILGRCQLLLDVFDINHEKVIFTRQLEAVSC